MAYDANVAIAILLISFLAMVVLRFPIAYSIALSSIFCLVYMGKDLAIVGQYMVKGISSYSLMAVPFFITMGCFMGSGGISDKIVAFANAIVGWMRGGLGAVNVLDSFFFGGISGSAAADTASLGSILIPMMVEQGYDVDFSTGLTIASSVEGILVPPSHNMVIYATCAGGISVGSLFMAGYLPGATLALSLMVGTYIISVKRNYPKGDKFNIVNLIKTALSSVWALMSLVIVIVGVMLGWFTATESAAIAVIYSLLVSLYIYKGLDWKGVWNELGNAVETLAIVMILIATSSIFGYCLTTLHLPELATNLILGFSSNPIVLRLLINVILLFLGMIMDMAPIILITTPILLPIAMETGMDPVTYGVMLMLNCGIGLLTPPVGSVLFIGSAIAKRPVMKVVKGTLPFYACMIVALMLITFVPDITLLLPKLTMGYVPVVGG